MTVMLASRPAVASEPAPASSLVPVWDLVVRLFHWTLVVAVGLTLVSGFLLPRTWINLHLLGGTLAIILVGGRVVWGLWGTTYARFSSFAPTPRGLAAHVHGALGSRHGKRHRGHNPAGALMVFVLMATIAGLGISGAVALGGVLKSGPLAAFASHATGEGFAEAHELLANLLLVLIALHVAGVLYESRRTRENLAAAMIHGRKAARPGDVAPGPVGARPAVALVVAAALLAVGGFTVLGLSRLPARGAPTAALDPTYVAACGDCHIAYHPSLMPAATWMSMVDGLARHFGENATLEDDQTVAVRAYLAANAAEQFDTRAANRLRRTDPTDPLRITASPFWRRTHADIPDATFAAKAVGGRGNCAACHGDAAAGLFYPAAVRLPEGVRK